MVSRERGVDPEQEALLADSVSLALLVVPVALVVVNGASVGAVVAPRGTLSRPLIFKLRREKIVEIDVVADPARLRQLDLAVLMD
jgi:RNA polymerase sigma-70 factor (ECF subfamily)